MKNCSKCYQLYNLSEFKAQSNWCKNCHKQYQKEWAKKNSKKLTKMNKDRYESNKDEIRESQVWSRLHQRYGMSKDEYLRLNELQDGKCAICGNECKTNQRLVVDHNHENGQNRGLLCKSCNLHLGVLEKRLWVEKAMNYLEYWINEM